MKSFAILSILTIVLTFGFSANAATPKTGCGGEHALCRPGSATWPGTQGNCCANLHCIADTNSGGGGICYSTNPGVPTASQKK